MSSRPDLMAGVRLRVPLVIVIPAAAVLLIGSVTVLFSRVLLALPKEGATVVALAFAINILIACGVLAARRGTDTATLGELFVVVSYPVVIGIVLAIVGFGSGESGGEGEHAAGASGGGHTLAASAVQFSTDQLTFPANEETELVLKNDDSVEHDFAIFTDDTAEESLFEGQTAAPGSEVTYTIPPLEPGEYFFNCPLHPTAMTGTVTVE